MHAGSLLAGIVPIATPLRPSRDQLVDPDCVDKEGMGGFWRRPNKEASHSTALMDVFIRKAFLFLHSTCWTCTRNIESWGEINLLIIVLITTCKSVLILGFSAPSQWWLQCWQYRERERERHLFSPCLKAHGDHAETRQAVWLALAERRAPLDETWL